MVDGVPVYGTMAYDMTDHPPGTCIVMTRATWERNLEKLVPLLSGPMLDQMGRWLSQPTPGGSTSL